MSKPLLRYSLLLIAFLLVSALLVGFLATSFKVKLLDFENYLAATRLLQNGQNPYGVVEFFAPPWLALLVWPLTLLSPAVSSAIWLLLLFACTAVAVVLSLRWLQRTSKTQSLLFTALLPMLMPGALYSYITGQISSIINLAVLLAAWQIATATTTWLPILGLLLATLKPHIVAFPAALCVLELARQRRWRALLAAALSLLVLCILAFVVLPNWLPALLQAWAEGRYRGGQPGLISPGFTGLPELGIPFWVFLPLGLYALWRWLRLGLTAQVFALALVTNLLLVPYSRSYDFVVLSLPLLTLAEFKHWYDWVVFTIACVGVLILPWTSFSVLTPVVLAIALLLKTPAVTANPLDQTL